MKRVAAVLLSIALLCPVISRAEYDLSAMSDADLLQLRTEINLELLSRQPQPADALGSGVVNDCTVTLRAIKLGKDRDGNDGAALFFTLANGSESTTDFQHVVHVQVFQDGVECDSALVKGSDSADAFTTDSTTWTVKVQPGAATDTPTWGCTLYHLGGIIEVQLCDAKDYRHPVIASFFVDLDALN